MILNRPMLNFTLLLALSRSSSVEGQESTSLPQSPPLHVAHESLHTETTPDDALENVQSMKPSASPDAPHGTTPRTIADEITWAERKFVPSGQFYLTMAIVCAICGLS
jgi:hypothetical protein